MILKSVLRSVLSVIVCFVVSNTFAQPILPDMVGASDKGINILSWTCQYEGIKSIAVQRSTDSVYNYATVGYVKQLKKGPQAYIDGHPDPGDNWYRLYIVFNSDLTWYSNRIKIHIDSAALLNKGVLPPNDSLQKYATGIKMDTSSTTLPNTPSTNLNPYDTVQQIIAKLTIDIPEPEEIDQYTYIKSQYVFTNPFTGHINIEIPVEDGYHFYSLKFFNLDDVEVLDIKRFTENEVIVDKRNFRKKGIYKFILKKDRDVVEEGHITIY